MIVKMKNNMVDLSIFLPIYNGEKYIEECLNSILNQSFGDFELVIFDDASTDMTYNICERYALKDSRIILKKGDAGREWVLAMNRFLGEARGEYITFIDGDDYISPKHFENIINAFEQQDADAVIASYAIVDQNGKPLDWYAVTLDADRTYTQEEIIRECLLTNNIEGFRWNKAFRKEIYSKNGIQYENTFAEDMIGTFKALSCSKKVVHLAGVTYFYRQQPQSLVAKIDAEKIITFGHNYTIISKLADKSGFSSEAQFFYLWRHVYLLHHNLCRKSYFTKEDWVRIKECFKWNDIVHIPLFKVFKVLYAYASDGKDARSMCIKACIVRIVFS